MQCQSLHFLDINYVSNGMNAKFTYIVSSPDQWLFDYINGYFKNYIDKIIILNTIKEIRLFSFLT